MQSWSARYAKSSFPRNVYSWLTLKTIIISRLRNSASTCARRSPRRPPPSRLRPRLRLRPTPWRCPHSMLLPIRRATSHHPTAANTRTHRRAVVVAFRSRKLTCAPFARRRSRSRRCSRCTCDRTPANVRFRVFDVVVGFRKNRIYQLTSGVASRNTTTTSVSHR